MDFPLLFYIILPIVAFLYASVGHGGASGYLALMALFNANISLMKPTALILNIFVAGIAFILYLKKGHFKFNLFLPFAITSIPAAFIGGYMEVDPDIYKKILGILLLFSVARLLGWIGKDRNELRKAAFWQSALIGLAIGFFSGLIGIGGGIILSPVILLLHWANMKETASVSALFILVNSFAGLSGLYLSGWTLNFDVGSLVALALLGGSAGAYLGSFKINDLHLRRLLAFVLVIASAKLIMT